MSAPRDDLPTTVIPQQTVEQPAVTTAPATHRARVWQRKLPQRIGRARTSTVIIGCLFVLLGGLNFVLPQDPYVNVTTEDGQVVRVRSSQLSTPPTLSPTPSAPTSDVPSTTTSAPTGTQAPSTTAGEDEEGTTAPQTTPRTTAEQTTSSPSSTSSRASSTSRAPSTTAPSPSEEDVPEETADPTG